MTKNNIYKICPNCDFFSNIEEDGSFCPQCGKELIHKCPQCGEDITNPYAKFCKHCGEPYPGRKIEKTININF
ncbi:MAG: zinc ribbon domain-containing protein [Candidatus Marinimicrobia bacterium]|jgi:hypothetical protein|nr:zinc ribbon domain-containing protein [Candidatus Neomarinimicrobiota bacterium]